MSFPYEDSDLDRRLQDVPLPPGFLARMKQIGALPEREIDHALTDVALPPGLLYRLRGANRKLRRRMPVSRMALAATVLLALGVSYFGSIAAIWISGHRQRQATQPVAENDADRLPENHDFISPALTPSEPRPNGATPNSLPTDPPRAVASDETQSWQDFFKHVWSTPLNPAPAGQPANGGGPTKSSIYASRFDPLPELPSVAGMKAQGIAPPRIKGYDLAFQLKYNVHPFVTLANAPSLKTCAVPVTTDAAGFEALVNSIEQGRLPAADMIRVEEILAAIDYQFPLPKSGALGIRAAAGPSPLGRLGGAAGLLQVAVQAPELPKAKTAPALLVIAVDGATQFADDRGRPLARQSRVKQWIVKALGDRARRLGADERLVVVACGQPATVLADQTGPTESLAEKLSAATFAGGNWALGASPLAGLRLGCQIAETFAAETKRPARVVLLSANPTEFGEPAAEAIDQRVDQSLKAGVCVDVVACDKEEFDVNSSLMRLAQHGEGSLHKATSAAELKQALDEIAADRSLIAAAGVLLKVTFNPKAVLAYRLIGHEATAGGGLLSAPLEGNLLSGQAATGLFEVVLQPDGEPLVATIEASWVEPGTNKYRKTSQTVSRLQFAPSLIEAPLSLQAAALAAETGEVLRNSYFAPSSAHSLRRVRELAGQMNPRLLQNPSVVQLLDAVDRASRLNSNGSRPTK